jgi:hypothetical protein
MKLAVRVIIFLMGGGLLLATQACTPQQVAAVEHAVGMDLGTTNQINHNCEKAFGQGAAEPGGKCWQVGVELINNANHADPPRPATHHTTPRSTASHPASHKAATSSSNVSNLSRWDRIAHCESGGQWGHVPVTNKFGTFSGGLMIMNQVWRQFGGQQFAPLAYQASKAQQIIVAERIWARVGSRAWQCKA